MQTCFDQIPRVLVHELAVAAGMPHKVISAYARFQNGLKVYTTSANGA